ncbi:MAG TPA: LLM class flavin-dependent oxidoreductase [Jatrophihabitans sp.]|jgi:FMN-dependent oxidoreductase (nitrilotriacetate monooxygenase family)
MTRQLHLNAFLMGTGHHEAAWRHPDSRPEDTLDAQHYVRLAQIAERGKLDSIFFADNLAISRSVRYNSANHLEPITLLAAIAMLTERIGLIATASTSYYEPFQLARKFASLDHISKGRAGWNIVTSAGEDEAQNFNLDKRPAHADRYARATEFVEVAQRLWDSWGDNARVLDKDTGHYADTDLISPIEHIGKYFQVQGPLNLPRPVQGHPLLVQAGSSEAGREYAARFAEAVFTAQQTLDDGQAFYADLKSRVTTYGRRPEDVLILPGICAVLGGTEAEAKAKEAELNALISPEYSVDQLSRILEHDLKPYPLDGPLPPLPDEDAVAGMKSRSTLVKQLARRENLTIRQVIERMAGGRGHRVFAGTPEQVADQLDLWFHSGAADGFNVMPPNLPGGLEDFVEHVVPELQRRGLFRTEYTGTTLREHYGLARPVPNTNRTKEHAA